MKHPPGKVFDAYITDCAAGATVGVQITNPSTGTVYTARSTSVTEYAGGTTTNPSALSVFKASLVAPHALGSYLIWWDVNGSYASEDLVIDGPPPLIDNLQVGSPKAVQLGVKDNSSVRVTNLGSDTVYYGGSTVTALSHTGTITLGNSLNLTTDTWFISAGSTRLIVSTA